MRDLVLATTVGVLLLLTFKHPVLGAYLWAWLSLMNPHKLAFGFARGMPFALMAAMATLLVLMGTKKRQPLPMSPIVVIQISMLLWMSVTSVFAVATFDMVLERWIFVLKIHVMLMATWMLVTTEKQFRILIWIVTLSVAFFGIKGGVFTVISGGSSRVWGPPGGMLEENNALAVALVMMLPFMYFLYMTEPKRWVRNALVLSMISLTFSIVGSQSRGALLALFSMSFFLGLKSKYPFRTSLGLLVLLLIVVAFMPDSWSNRMDTIQTYKADTSAMSRIWTWQTLWNAALDRPIVGVGFRADNHMVFGRYAPQGGEWEIFKGTVFVAHSIYLQMLGEHGFVGLALFLGILGASWFGARGIAKQALLVPDLKDWMPLLMRMVQVSLMGYFAGGAFLSLAYLDLPYYIMGYVVTAGILLKRAQTLAPKSVPPAGRGATAVVRKSSSQPAT